jgi:hypothetical protein
LSPQAYRRLVREAVTQPYAKAAAALREDWGCEYDAKQLQRWTHKAGKGLLALQTQERQAYLAGQRPDGPTQDPRLLVIGMDGGRVQSRDKSGPEGSRWREDKVLTISSYEPGDGKKQEPRVLMTTCLATLNSSREFGVQARLEAERRGIRQAPQVVVMGDGAAWIDTLHQEHFGRHVRIVDWYHASEHLHEVARATHPEAMGPQRALADRLTRALWRGRAASVALTLAELSHRAGPPQIDDPPGHPRRVLQNNAGYFQRHAPHMNYPAYRRRGWPIGSGVTEGGVKQFNKRVKGTEQFWNESGVEAILALRSLWLSDDDRWNHYWSSGRLLRQAA